MRPAWTDQLHHQFDPFLLFDDFRNDYRALGCSCKASPCATALGSPVPRHLSYCFANTTFAEISEIQCPLRTSP